jgi:hypothetical protein
MDAQCHLRDHVLTSLEAYTWALAMDELRERDVTAPMYETLVGSDQYEARLAFSQQELFDGQPSARAQRLYEHYATLIQEAIDSAERAGWVASCGGERGWFGRSGMVVFACVSARAPFIRTAMFPRAQGCGNEALNAHQGPELLRDVKPWTFNRRGGRIPAKFVQPRRPNPHERVAPCLYRGAFEVAWSTVSERWYSALNHLNSQRALDKSHAAIREQLYQQISSRGVKDMRMWSSLFSL